MVAMAVIRGRHGYVTRRLALCGIAGKWRGQILAPNGMVPVMPRVHASSAINVTVADVCDEECAAQHLVAPP